MRYLLGLFALATSTTLGAAPTLFPDGLALGGIGSLSLKTISVGLLTAAVLFGYLVFLSGERELDEIKRRLDTLQGRTPPAGNPGAAMNAIGLFGVLGVGAGGNAIELSSGQYQLIAATIAAATLCGLLYFAVRIRAARRASPD